MRLSEVFPDMFTMHVFEVVAERPPCYPVKLCGDSRIDKGTMRLEVQEGVYPLNYRSVLGALSWLESHDLIVQMKDDGMCVKYALSEKGVVLFELI